MMSVKDIKKDVSQQEKIVLLQLHYLHVLHIKEITLVVLDIRDQMEFVKEMLEALHVDQENVKMVHLILMNFANNTKQVVKQMARLVFQH